MTDYKTFALCILVGVVLSCCQSKSGKEYLENIKDYRLDELVNIEVMEPIMGLKKLAKHIGC